MRDSIKMCKDNGQERFDKKQIALAIRNSTFDDEFGCSILHEGCINSCDQCNFKSICKDIDEVANKYLKDTTLEIKKFEF